MADQQHDPVDESPQWEYYLHGTWTKFTSSDTERRDLLQAWQKGLNEAGRKGWEAVGNVTLFEGTTPVIHLLMKRRLV
jgi:hypothetical protein